MYGGNWIGLKRAVLIPGQRFHACLKGETTTDWKGYAGLGPQMVVNPKMKAKPAATPVIYKGGGASRGGGLADGAMGAMTDASKRRLDEGWDVMMAGVEEPIADPATTMSSSIKWLMGLPSGRQLMVAIRP